MEEHREFLKESDELRDLRVLEEIERNPSVSQRELARTVGVALGIANACVHTLVRKGLVKVRGESNRSITYHLTKKGVLHKARLAVEWTANTIDFYVQARRQVALQLAALRERGAASVVLFGADEVTELAVMVAPEAGVRVVAIVSPERLRVRDEILGMPVSGMEDPTGEAVDAVVACARPTDEELGALVERLAGVPVYTLPGEELARGHEKTGDR